MKMLNRFFIIPLFIILVLTGCKEEKKEVEKKVAASIPEQTIVFNQVNMINHLRSIQEITLNNGGDRVVGGQGIQATRQYILEQIEKTKLKKTVTTFDNTENAIGQNIVVEIPGESSNSIVLIGTHYDSGKGSPGINDNASGVAVVLELMHQFHQTKKRPKYTIKLAFWDSEESGTMGSAIYASKLNETEFKEIKAYINLDMVGTRHPTARIADTDKSSLALVEVKLREQGKSREEIESELTQLRAIESHSGDSALEKSLKTFFESQKIEVEENIEMIGLTDTSSFTGKVPVVAFGLVNVISENELVPCYHKACDTIDLIDPQSLVLAGNGTIHLLKNLNAL